MNLILNLYRKNVDVHSQKITPKSDTDFRIY